MGTSDKLTKRVLSVPSDLTYSELKNFLKQFGYQEDTKGKTSGSRVRFIRETDNSIILLHKPHPGNIVKQYAIKLVINTIKEQGDLDE